MASLMWAVCLLVTTSLLQVDLTLSRRVEEQLIEKNILAAEASKQGEGSADDTEDAVKKNHGADPALTDDSMAKSLERDPEEEIKYNAQMLSSIGNKTTLLNPMVSRALQEGSEITIIDIGPAGGAIPKALAQMVKFNGMAKAANIHYLGVELNVAQVTDVQNFLDSESYNPQKSNLVDGKPPGVYFGSAQCIEGNALNLANTMPGSLGYSVIVESSVVHEIYSYAPVKKMNIAMPRGLVFNVPMQPNDRYNPEVVYKNHEESLLQLSKKGGVLSLRDGVLYEKPAELVTFKLKSDDFVGMFKLFREDSKYSGMIEAQLKDVPVEKNVATKLSAGLLQEFILKANWGMEGWANEIHEVYCYATLATHLKIIQDIGSKKGLRLNVVEQKQYTQDGYIIHTKDHIEILAGFGPKKFPPTNLLIQVEVIAA